MGDNTSELFVVKQIDIVKRNLAIAKNHDWAGQIIYCQILINKYENILLDIFLNYKTYP